MIGEFEIIERYFKRASHDADVVLGVGDDAAVLKIDGLAAVTVDTLVAGVHFPHEIAPELLGHRVLAVNLSDLAAMGVQPRWATLALTLPKADADWLDRFARGFFELADEFDVALVGGDLARGPLTATVQLIGKAESGRYLTRAGGNAGDDVYVTGTLGDSAAGIALVSEQSREPSLAAKALMERFYRPQPRVREGRALAPLASAAIDVSDGLLADLAHICDASACGAVIDVECVPLSAELLELFPPQDALAYALSGGDDYELCFTASPARADSIEAAMDGCGARVKRIGQLVEGREVICRRDHEPFVPPSRGYTHF